MHTSGVPVDCSTGQQCRQQCREVQGQSGTWEGCVTTAAQVRCLGVCSAFSSGELRG